MAKSVDTVRLRMTVKINNTLAHVVGSLRNGRWIVETRGSFGEIEFLEMTSEDILAYRKKKYEQVSIAQILATAPPPRLSRRLEAVIRAAASYPIAL